jgi:hypothetical protein
LDPGGGPTHDEVRDALGLDPKNVIAYLIIEPDGQTTVMPSGGTWSGYICEEWAWLLDERLSQRTAHSGLTTMVSRRVAAVATRLAARGERLQYVAGGPRATYA